MKGLILLLLFAYCVHCGFIKKWFQSKESIETQQEWNKLNLNCKFCPDALKLFHQVKVSSDTLKRSINGELDIKSELPSEDAVPRFYCRKADDRKWHVFEGGRSLESIQGWFDKNCK